MDLMASGCVEAQGWSLTLSFVIAYLIFPEEEVVQDTEAVFCSYVRYRYHQEMEQGEQSTPNPEIIALQPDESR